MNYHISTRLITATVISPHGFGQAAEISDGGGLTPESAVRVLAAESEEDLTKCVTRWIRQRYPQDIITVRSFEYLADDRALYVIKTLTVAGTHRTIFFKRLAYLLSSCVKSPEPGVA